MILQKAEKDASKEMIDAAFVNKYMADDELAAIILRACSIYPTDRWQDPIQMGQALVNYIQKNGTFDTPIVPPAPIPEPAAEPEEITEEDEFNSIDDEEDYADDDLSDLTILNEDELDSEE